MEEHRGNTALFGIFIVTILSLFLVPITIWKCCGGGAAEDEAVQPWVTKKKKKSAAIQWFSRQLTLSNAGILLLWVVLFAILAWTQQGLQDQKPFDPFEILQLPQTATEREIKKAYRSLSLRFHPDKNPDPKAQQYFTEYINKAYQALTDETARKNWEEFGHPDGRQAINIGVALPEWIFSKDSKSAPFLLAGLVGGGIMVPLLIAAYFLYNSNKFVGPNQLLPETIEMFYRSPYAVKPSQSLARIPETLVIAMEFIQMPVPHEQQAALDELRKTILRVQPELKDKSLFWKRRTSVLKVHMLLLAYLAREPIPAILTKDLHFVLKRCLVLLEEMAKIANLPLVGAVARALQWVFVTRKGTSDERNAYTTSGKTTDIIAERAKDPRFPLLAVAPEGTTKCVECLLQFSRGAFLSGQPVLPVLLRYPHRHFNVAWGPCNTPLHMYRLMSQFVNRLEVEILEPYMPNAAERASPDLYAENVRKLMANRLGIPLVEQGAAEHDVLYRVGVTMNNSFNDTLGPRTGKVKVLQRVKVVEV